ncbi:MAG: hypothetical protein ACJ74W_24050 [Pyrinomonadaceae bacterium]
MTRENMETEQYTPRDITLTGAVLVLALAVSLIFGYAFEQMSDPPPSTFERIIFYGLLFMIFLETVYAGWYRLDD